MKKSLILICILMLTISCSKKNEAVPVSEEVGEAYQELDSTAMFFYSGKKLQWKLESKHLKKVLVDTGHIVSHPVKLYVYDTLGKETSRVLSDSGSTDGNMQSFCVWGNVFVKAENGVRVRSNRLVWNQKTHLVTSNDYVQLKTLKGDILQGKGLEAAEDFAWWKFLHDVSGVFPNFKERVEKGEEF